MLEKAKEFLLNSGVEPVPEEGLNNDASANNNDEKQTPTTFSFHQGSAEDLRQIIPDGGTVDLLIAAQACHWFDWTKVWPETRRVLRKGGTAAFWVYGEFRLPAFPGSEPIIAAYTDPHSPTSVGSYFERPGRTILERLLVDVPAPEDVLGIKESDGLKDFQRVYFAEPDSIPDREENYAHRPGLVHPVLMRASWTWLQLLGYLRTWSALHAYLERHSEDLKHEDDARFLQDDLNAIREMNHSREAYVRGGDVCVRFWKDLREVAEKQLTSRTCANGSGDSIGFTLMDKVTVEWPLSLLLARKA
ncbi:hypothetical protein CC1G_07293 [Coprinopsis cinerea okayama7|uniref:Methyltransferase type 11 domain-containing protein n=1 Tax=Coprinopsis cinerea (strain Okayama-7 / 130 / ATCC MYA-4618 / FGSC 9003) TaxID=240176 RepID=A8NNL5_COPC7|nr:hypothetical protein CC1G_07293 [Coprinopsis cinerea okayama7\|eukprot:XP_001835151.2 hypothetical protein CC1G_07293 [Coprinopsis cinerea okayama7\